MVKLENKRIIGAVLCVVLALVSVFGIAKPMTDIETHAETIASLDAKKETVMELTAASTAASAAITLIPGDVATPIATKLIVLGLAIALVIPASVKVSGIIEETYSSSIQQTIESATQATEDIQDAAQRENKKGLNIISNITRGVSGAMEEMETVINRFMEAIAVMVVTSCVVPIVVLLFFVWVVKAIIGVRAPMPKRIAGYLPEE